MCGRYAINIEPEELAQHFQLDFVPEVAKRYNVAPTQLVPIIRSTPDHRRELKVVTWGLIPSWAKDRSLAAKMINGRAETLAEKPAFRSAFKKSRCIVPASGFFEWRKVPEGKDPFYIGSSSSNTIGFAGLLERWNGPDGPVDSCTIVTTEASERIRSIHERMPVILPPTHYAKWLGETQSTPDELRAMLVGFPDDELAVRRVSTAVNNARNDKPECVVPVAEQSALF